jgi:hypothetical protein
MYFNFYFLFSRNIDEKVNKLLSKFSRSFMVILYYNKTNYFTAKKSVDKLVTCTVHIVSDPLKQVRNTRQVCEHSLRARISEARSLDPQAVVFHKP